MDSKQAWEWFTISGSVEAYLLYQDCVEEEKEKNSETFPPLR